jgi:hypothetical protein
MALDGSEALTIPGPAIELEEDEVSVQNICCMPKAWAPHFLALLSPYLALQAYRLLLQTIPPALQKAFDFLGTWLAIACTLVTNAAESSLKAK